MFDEKRQQGNDHTEADEVNKTIRNRIGMGLRDRGWARVEWAGLAGLIEGIAAAMSTTGFSVASI